MTSQQFQLIDGTFAKEDALFILLSFFNEKIAYHNRKLLVMKLKNDPDIKIVEEKLASLDKTRFEIAQFFESAGSGKANFKLNGSISILSLPDEKIIASYS